METLILKLMIKILKTAIIGYGVVGKRRKMYIERNKNYKLLYISDIKFKKNIKSKTIIFFKNYKEILKQNIDVVFITLPTYLAARVTLTFIKKGVHVFCEKPPARNVNEIKKVIQTSKKFPHIKIKYGFNHRYHSSVKLAKKIIKSKKYGKILNLRCLYGKSKIVAPYDNRFTGSKDDWRSKKKLSGGGILLDQGIHLLDLIRFFNGDFQEYKSFVSNKFWNYDVEDNVFALMRDKNGVIASIHSTATQWQHTFRIEITAKYALIELKGILSGTKSYGKESLRIIERLPKSSNGFKLKNQYYFSKDNSWKEEIDEFANIILKKLSVKTGNIYDALKVMDMVEKIYRADKKGI